MASTLVLLHLFSLFCVGTLLMHCTLHAQAVDDKEATCCKKTSVARIQTEITKCVIHPKTDNCVAAVIFFSNGKSYCSGPHAKWVRNTVNELKKKGTPCLDWRKNFTLMD
ncbi:hypothetical protein ACEWY4_019037 [Coilia grayii]|uniref:Chemokine interleukin-8-like domain-containing protein n=1 Tax=Coilia grayii TaxID=363190 RepID=A0ABD1JEW9_9TELE